MNDIKFYIYTKFINFFLKKKNFEKVNMFLGKKKEIAKKIRNEKINRKTN